MARIGYAKIGRSWNLNPEKATSVGGDIDVINALIRLAKTFPEHEFVLVGKNSGEDPAEFGYPPNVTNPWTEWKDNWTVATDPTKADQIIEHFRTISGNVHETLDHFIVWAGQHGSANSRIPMIGSNWITPPGQETIDFDISHGPELSNERNDVITGGVGENLATPQYAFIHYVSWLLDLLSRWREAGPGPEKREEIWLCPDPRNYLKCREKRWPIRYPVLAQYDFLKYHKGERFGRFPSSLSRYDPTGYRENTLWVSNVAYCYSGLELTAVNSPDQLPFDPIPGPNQFGVVMNENLKGVKDSRLQLLQSWILPNFPDAAVRGHWTEESQILLKRVIEPVPYTDVMRVMKSFATTLTTPASGSGWATAKPWEAFALGSVCFFHPRYDDQGWILPIEANAHEERWNDDARMLGSYLRVTSAEQLAERVKEVTENQDLYYAIVTAQRRWYEHSFARLNGGVTAIAERISQAEGELQESGQSWLQLTSPPGAVVSSRASARPRGTNEERKKKPPISRRRPLRESLQEKPVDEHVEVEEPATDHDEARDDKNMDTCKSKFSTLPGSGFFVPGLLSATAPLSLGTPLAFTGNPEKILPRAQSAARRATKDEYFLAMAEHVATQSTCARRSVGCVLVNGKKRVLATGFNGVPRGFPHCNEGHPCPGAKAKSGEELHRCYSAHAEINALLQCPDVDDIETVYLTVSPCVECIKAILNTGATRIVFREEYVQPESKQLWLSREGNEWIKL